MPRSSKAAPDRMTPQAFADAARKLCELRDEWLNPKSTRGAALLSDATLAKRTLTRLYNERPTWLELAHLELYRALLAAYGWPESLAEQLQPRRDDKGLVNPIPGATDPAAEQDVLARRLALNAEAAKA